MSERFFRRHWIALALIGAGMLLIVLFGVRSARAYHHINYLRGQGGLREPIRLDAIQPWMTVRYVAVAYSVPEEYIFAQLDIRFDQRNSHDTLQQLDRRYDLGMMPDGEASVVIPLVADAIQQYRQNPVATGLADVRPWMTIRYVSNSTGVPENYLLEQLGIPPGENHALRQLDRLASDVSFRCGSRGLLQAITVALDSYSTNQDEDAP